MYKLSVIIVSYNVKDLVRDAVQALIDSRTNFLFEIIVIDNGSSDNTVEMLEATFKTNADWQDRIQLYANTNEGFPKGNNRGLRMRRGEYVLFLNPDTKVSPDTLQSMMDFMQEHPEVGIATCKLVKGDGTIDRACRRSFPNPVSAFFRLSGLSLLFPKSKLFATYNLSFEPEDKTLEIDSCSGAFMFVSPVCMREIKGFDETYYMYGEDIDLCMRAKRSGFKVWYYPKSTTIHYRGQSSKKSSARSLYAFHHAMWIFYKRYYSKTYHHVLDPLVFMGIWSRYVIKRIINSLKSEPYVSK